MAHVDNEVTTAATLVPVSGLVFCEHEGCEYPASFAVSSHEDDGQLWFEEPRCVGHSSEIARGAS